MGKKADVEIVPWFHDFDFPAHESVIEFIKGLPRNSTLALEAREKELIKVRENPKHVLETIMAQKELIFKSEFLALFEVIHECMKKNIKIIPIESHILVEAHIRSDSGGRLDPRISMDRDHAFARKIKNHLSTFKGNEIIVLVGLGHITGVQEELKELGINSRINTTIFGQDRNFMERYVTLSREERTAILRSDTALFDSKTRELFDLRVSSNKRRRADPQAKVDKMFKEIEERNKTAQEAKRERLERAKARGQKSRKRVK